MEQSPSKDDSAATAAASMEVAAAEEDVEDQHIYHQPTPADPTKYTILQVNGCRSNRALDFNAPEPPTSCELFVKNVPRRFKGEDLWPLFERYGRIYNIRVMMDYSDLNRGFAYVKYSRESEATLAMELMNYFFVFPGHRLNITRSTAKSRLFANYLPKNVPVQVIHDKFREIFPEMRDFVMPTFPDNNKGRSTPAIYAADIGALHRGFAFLEFRSHQDAVAAKKMVYTGVLEIWGSQVKIGWARPPEEMFEDDDVDCYPKLFLRPFPHGTRPGAFLEFLEERGIGGEKVVRFDMRKAIGVMKVTSLQVGEEAIRQLSGKEFSGQKLKVDWFRERNTDAKRYGYCKALELMCTANQWAMPVIMFGRIFPERCEQYACLFTTFRGHIFSMFVKVALNDKLDMTSRISEVFLALIEDTGYLPCYNYVIELEENIARIAGFVNNYMELTRTYKSGDISHNFYWYEMMELNWAVQKLARVNPRYLYEKYQDAIDNSLEREGGHDQYLMEGISTNNRIFTSVYNDQTNMTLLLLCDKITQSNKYYATGGPPSLCSTMASPMCYGKHPQSFQLSRLDWIKKEKEG